VRDEEEERERECAGEGKGKETYQPPRRWYETHQPCLLVGRRYLLLRDPVEKQTRKGREETRVSLSDSSSEIEIANRREKGSWCDGNRGKGMCGKGSVDVREKATTTNLSAQNEAFQLGRIDPVKFVDDAQSGEVPPGVADLVERTRTRNNRSAKVSQRGKKRERERRVETDILQLLWSSVQASVGKLSFREPPAESFGVHFGVESV